MARNLLCVSDMYHSNHLNSMQQTQGIETVPHITDHQMILDALAHHTRSSIRALQTFLGIAILAGSCAWLMTSFVSAAELFPYTPPSPSQQRSVERQSAAKPQLSAEDLERISKIATQARNLEPSKKIQLKNSIQRNLDDAVANGKLNQAKYFSQLLRQID